MKRLVIIDGMSVFYRGYYAVGALATAAGVPTGGAYGFAAMAMRVVQDLKPDKVVVAWDKAETSTAKRLAIYPEYKAGRPIMPEDFYAQIDLVRELAAALNWGWMECDNYEADDIIGSLARLVKEDGGWGACIISSDLDMLQVVDENIKMYRLIKGFTELEEFSVTEVEEKYGIKKSQFLDMKAIKGDASDNIPGVPGIGEKGAVKLLNEFGDLEGIYAHLGEISGKTHEKLEKGRQSAYMSYELAKIMTDAPVRLEEIPDFVLDKEKARRMLNKLEFYSLVKRFKLDDVSQERKIAAVPEGDYQIAHEVIEWDVKEVMKTDEKVAEKVLGGEKFWDLEQGRFLLNPLQKKAELDLLAMSEEGKKAEYIRQQKEYKGLAKLKRVLVQLDFPLIPVLYKMEKRGMKIDRAYFEDLKKSYEEKEGVVAERIYEMAGGAFNINSPKQLSEVLFFRLGLPTKGIKKSASKEFYSTGVKELAKLSGTHPIIEAIKEYREASKLLSTYIVPMASLADAEGRIHTSFTQNVTATGRLSSVNPNLQNIPTRTEEGRKIRGGFVAEEGKVLVGADYSQFELRLAAALSGDQALIDDFNAGVDIHKKTAAEVFGVPMGEVTKKQRRAAKVVNFGIIYGMSAKGLADATEMSLVEAKAFIEKYFELRAPIKRKLDEFLEQARGLGYVETYYGRRRPTPDVSSGNYLVRAAAERAAQNMPIQGTEADLMKKAMLAVDKALPEGADLIMQVHDSLIVECREELADEVARILTEKMEGVAPELPVKLAVEVERGKNWGEI